MPEGDCRRRKVIAFQPCVKSIDFRNIVQALTPSGAPLVVLFRPACLLMLVQVDILASAPDIAVYEFIGLLP